MGKGIRMTGNLSQDWIVYVLFAGAIIWVAFMLFPRGKNKKDEPPTEKDNKTR